MFDLLLQEVAKKFGLGNKASWILSTLLSHIFSRGNGGLSGFLEQLTQGGLGQVVSSWLGNGKPMAINAGQVERVMGHDAINNLASNLDLDSSPVSKAIAHMLPKVVSELTPNGIIPDTIPSDVNDYIKEDHFVQTKASILKYPEHKDYTIEPEPIHKKSGFNWWWLLLLPLLLLLGWCTLKQTGQAPEQTPALTQSSTSVSEPEIAEIPVATLDSSLSITHESVRPDYFNISGRVADTATKESIFNQLNSVVGSDQISGDIDVNPAVKKADWLMKLPAALPALKGAPGATLRLNGNDVVLDGHLKPGTTDGLIGELQGVFGPDYNIRSQAIELVSSPEVLNIPSESVSATPAIVENDTSEATIGAIQDTVISNTATDENWVNVLNMTEINFASSSHTLTSKSMIALRNAARVIKAAPAYTRIEVAGHTDSSGSSQINTVLSRQRSQAVVDALVRLGVDASMLGAKGYGDSQPIADNSSQQGRSLNRRIEFTVE